VFSETFARVPKELDVALEKRVNHIKNCVCSYCFCASLNCVLYLHWNLFYWYKQL